jgi:hypothetical protein
LFAVAALLPVSSAADRGLRDLYFGEAVYYAYQEHYFEALERLDTEIAQHYGVDEPRLDSLHYHINQAEFSVGDFELHYRMHHRAGRAIKAVLEADVDESVRNEAAFRLARIHFQKDQPYAALHALERISGRIPEAIRDDVEFLRANIYMATGRPSAAVDALRPLQDSKELTGLSTYNLGIALLQDGKQQEAIRQLDRAGQVRGGDGTTLAIRDKSNLVLGTLLFESAEFGPAQRSLDRVRLTGPFSNQALLRAGWADVSAEKFDVLYGRAVETFGEELDKVDASIRSIREGEFLKALVREEIRQDKDWVIHLRRLPEAPETFYLMALMASHDFQTALQNYLDLEDLRKKLVSWERNFDAFEDIIRLRRQYYEPLLPEIDRRFRKLDAQLRLRLEQRKHLAGRLQHMLIAPRPDHLATADEQRSAARIDQMEAGLQDANDPEQEAVRLRLQRLKGVLTWRLETQYHQRLTDVHEHLRELNADVDALTAQYDAFVRARQAATHSYVGYEIPINGLRVRVADALERLDVLMARQGRMLETVAVEELRVRRERLEAYENQARFAFADSYDRAAKAQAQ